MSGRDRVELAELVDEPFIETPVSWGNRSATDAAFARAGLSRRIAYEIGDVASFVSLVKHHLGVAVVPMSFIDLEDGIRAVPLGADAPELALSLAVPAGHPVSAPAKALLQLAVEMHEAGA
jgi:DNA-binding transcriptional LysR family regulator